jgi:phage terminase Nu1 subunit (DNA packaging protein)
MTVLPFPSQDPERYVSRMELAEIMGVSVDTIDRLRKAGMPSYTWGMRTRRFLASEATRWASQHGVPKEGLRAA